MLEILLLINLTNRIGAIVEQKGYKGGAYKLTTVLLWFGGEIVGAIIGALLTGGDESARCVTYIIALIGAGIGAGISYAIANNLAVIGPSLTPVAAGQPSVTSSIGAFPAPLLWFLWLLTNAVANVGWGLIYNLINPTYEESLMGIAGVTSGAMAGFIAGILQLLLLILAIQTANRLHLAIWIPVTILSWALSTAAFNFIPITSNVFYFFVSVASGLSLGILQWLVLQKYSRVAIWWIAANIADWVLIWAINQSSLLYNISNIVAYNFIYGILGSIVSSIAIVFILKETHISVAENI